MRTKWFFAGMSVAMALLVLAPMGCIETTATSEKEENGPTASLTFAIAPIFFETKKVRADQRGVLWILSYDGKMHALDPDLHLSELIVCGEGIEDFALKEVGSGEDQDSQVYLAAGDNGLLRMDRLGRIEPDLQGDSIVSTYSDVYGNACAGGAEGVYTLDYGDGAWKMAGSPGTGSVSAPSRIVNGSEGICFEVWDNRMKLLKPGEDVSVDLEVENEQDIRVVELLRLPSGEIYLATSEGLYSLEDEMFKLARYSDDPIMSAALRYGDILLGKSSGAVTEYSPSSGTETELGFLTGPVEHLGFSASGYIYAQSGKDVYLSRDLVPQPGRLAHAASFHAEVGTGTESPVGMRLRLPVTEDFSPEWFYYAVRADSGSLTWGLETAGSVTADAYLEGMPGGLSVEALAVAAPADFFLFQPGDSYPFPDSFPEDVRPYLSAGTGIRLDLPEIRTVLDSAPPETRGDMYSLLMFLVKKDGLFYQAPGDPAEGPLPPSPGSREAEEYAIEEASRVLRGEGGSDYARALALTELCRAAGMPARMVLSFEHYFNQVYISGAGWTAVDASWPVYDLQAPSYPAAGRLPDRSESFITATGGIDDDLRCLLTGAPEEGAAYSGAAGAPTVIFCRACTGRLVDESEALPLPGGGSFYFRRKGEGYLLVKKWPRREEEEDRIYQDEPRYPLTPDMEVALYLEGDGYVVIEGPEGL